MFSFFEDEKLTHIEKYFDDMSYLTKRILITDALHNRKIDSPFTKKEIIEYAQKEAKDGMFNASYSALDGYENDIYFIGKPSVDPVTNKVNSIEEQKGLFGDIGDKLTGFGLKSVLIVGASVVAFYYIKEKSIKHARS